MDYRKRDETALTRKILTYLNSLPQVVAWKVNQGTYSGMVGFPDVLCCYKGLFLAIEVKDGDNHTTAIQDYQIRKIKDALGVAFVVWSLDEVKKIVQLIDFYNCYHFVWGEHKQNEVKPNVETLEKAKMHDEQT